MNAVFRYLLAMSRARKRGLQLMVDSLALILLFICAMALRLDSLHFLSDPAVWLAFAPVLPITLCLFVRLGFYRAVIRYIAGHALVRIFLGAVLSGLALVFSARLTGAPIPRSVPVIYTVLAVIGLGGIRFAFRELVAIAKERPKTCVAIYGAGESGRQLVQMLRQGSTYRPVAFLDDSIPAQGTQVAGLPVMPPDQIETLIRSMGVRSVLLAIPSASRVRRAEILKELERLPIRLQSVPGLEDIMAGRARLDDLNAVRIEDLLGRDAVAPRADLLGANIAGKVVMVTGAGGSIGSELCRQILAHSPQRLVLFEQSEAALYTIEQDLLGRKSADDRTEIVAVLGSVQTPARVSASLDLLGVQTIYHAAAFKHVPMVEQNVVEGVRNNVFGTKALLNAALAAKVESFIMVSTDKAVRPTNVMGASKRLAEMLCQAKAQDAGGATRVSMVRFGNVLGSSGSVIPRFRQQIDAGGPITVTDPQITRFFMTIPEAAQLVIQAGAMARGGEVFVLDMGAPVRIFDLACQMARLHGLRPVLMAEGAEGPVGQGEIAIRFTGLRPGEKLFEELLIGDNPRPTRHPRIMSATERFLPMAVLRPLLARLELACAANDIPAIRRVLVEAGTGYQPGGQIAESNWTDAPPPLIRSPETLAEQGAAARQVITAGAVTPLYIGARATGHFATY